MLAVGAHGLRTGLHPGEELLGEHSGVRRLPGRVFPGTGYFRDIDYHGNPSAPIAVSGLQDYPFRMLGEELTHGTSVGADPVGNGLDTFIGEPSAHGSLILRAADGIDRIHAHA